MSVDDWHTFPYSWCCPSVPFYAPHKRTQRLLLQYFLFHVDARLHIPQTLDISRYNFTRYYSRYCIEHNDSKVKTTMTLSSSRKTHIPRRNGRAMSVFRELLGENDRDISGAHCTCNECVGALNLLWMNPITYSLFVCHLYYEMAGGLLIITDGCLLDAGVPS